MDGFRRYRRRTRRWGLRRQPDARHAARLTAPPPRRLTDFMIPPLVRRRFLLLAFRARRAMVFPPVVRVVLAFLAAAARARAIAANFARARTWAGLGPFRRAVLRRRDRFRVTFRRPRFGFPGLFTIQTGMIYSFPHSGLSSSFATIRHRCCSGPIRTAYRLSPGPKSWK